MIAIRGSLLTRTAFATVAVGLMGSAAHAIPGFFVKDSRAALGTTSLINYASSGGSSSFTLPADQAFPGGAGENFHVWYKGFVNVPVTGVYTIAVNQDDEIRINIGSGAGNQSIVDVGCCATSTYNVNLTAGVHAITAVFRELTGGESVEVSALLGASQPFSTATFRLLNDTANGSTLAVATTMAELTSERGMVGSGPTGFRVDIQNAAASPGVVGTTIDNANEIEPLILGGGAFEAGGLFTSVNFGNNTLEVPFHPAGVAFPAGTAGDDFALRASGFVDVEAISGIQQAFFYVDGDDGFRLKINGVTVSEFVGVTGGSNTVSGPVTIRDGDFLELFFFERGGGENLTFAVDFDGQLSTTHDRILVGDALSGIRIQQTNAGLVPEPASLSLLGLGGIALLRRRHRQA